MMTLAHHSTEGVNCGAAFGLVEHIVICDTGKYMIDVNEFKN